MKKGVHPQYRKVMFVDSSTGDEWTSYSTLGSSVTKEVDGEELPVIRLEISSKSHPFWTGQAREVDAEGRIDRFRRRYANRGKGKAKGKAKTEAPAADAPAADAPAAEAPKADAAAEAGADAS